MSQNQQAPGRNTPCPCGSGRKYKQCCLEKDEAALRETRAKAAAEAAKNAPAEEAEEKKAPPAKDGKPVQAKKGKGQTAQPWSRSGGNIPAQRASMPRKTGGK